MTILGIGDASEYDTFPTTDWNKASKMGCRFGIVRATTTGVWNYTTKKPTLREDSMFLTNTQKMAWAGIERMSYCWFDPRSQLTGREQAEFYIATVNKVGGPGKIAIVDVEKSGGIVYNAGSIARLREWLDIVSQTGWRLAIYSYPSGIDELATMADISWMKDYEFMTAHWGVPAPLVPFPWYPGGYSVWQYTNYMKGSLYGFNAASASKPAPRICMAVMNDPFIFRFPVPPFRPLSP
ncbi:MAG: hypothetical protein IMZ61_15770 [Planctomycetes bacterium]|nr:hypothetical protein [Planctomycetota bacterium]